MVNGNKGVWIERDGKLEETGIHRETADEAFLMPLIDKARDSLGAIAFTAAVDGGRTLTYEAATAESRNWLERGS